MENSLNFQFSSGQILQFKCHKNKIHFPWIKWNKIHMKIIQLDRTMAFWNHMEPSNQKSGWGGHDLYAFNIHDRKVRMLIFPQSGYLKKPLIFIFGTFFLYAFAPLAWWLWLMINSGKRKGRKKLNGSPGVP
jgi:hypothetical protein